MFNYFPDIFSSPFIIPIVAIMAGIAIPIVSSAWSDVEKHKRECELKRRMIDRGMSADEITQVLAAKMPAKESTSNANSAAYVA